MSLLVDGFAQLDHVNNGMHPITCKIPWYGLLDTTVMTTLSLKGHNRS